MYGGRCTSVDDVVGRVWGEREEIKKKGKKERVCHLGGQNRSREKKSRRKREI